MPNCSVEVKPLEVAYSPPCCCDASILGSEEESSIPQPYTNLPALSHASLQK